MNVINKINEFATNGKAPDLTFLIDIDIKEMEKRRKKMAIKLDRMEDQSYEFFSRVRDGYIDIAAQQKERFGVIDGKKSINAIALQIWKRVNKLL